MSVLNDPALTALQREALLACQAESDAGLIHIDEMNAGPEFWAAFVDAQSKIGAATKGESGESLDGKQYKYATLAAVQGAAMSALNAAGIAVLQAPVNRPALALTGCITTLRHRNGQGLRAQLMLSLADQHPHAVGSAITYARRYSLAALLMVPVEDDDGRAAMASAAKGRVPDAPKQSKASAGGSAAGPPPSARGKPPADAASSVSASAAGLSGTPPVGRAEPVAEAPSSEPIPKTRNDVVIKKGAHAGKRLPELPVAYVLGCISKLEEKAHAKAASEYERHTLALMREDVMVRAREHAEPAILHKQLEAACSANTHEWATELARQALIVLDKRMADFQGAQP